MISLEEDENDVVLLVKAQPGARRNAVTGIHDGALKVAVTQVPEKGKATAAIIDVIATTLGLKRSQIEIVSGQTSTHKKFLIRNMNAAELANRIAAVVDDA